MSAPQQQGERTFAEVWCDSLDDLGKASTTKSGAQRVIPRDEVVMRVASVLRLSLKAVRERMHCETPAIEAEIAAREAAEYRRLRKTLDTPLQRGTVDSKQIDLVERKLFVERWCDTAEALRLENKTPEGVGILNTEINDRVARDTEMSRAEVRGMYVRLTLDIWEELGRRHRRKHRAQKAEQQKAEQWDAEYAEQQEAKKRYEAKEQKAEQQKAEQQESSPGHESSGPNSDFDPGSESMSLPRALGLMVREGVLKEDDIYAILRVLLTPEGQLWVAKLELRELLAKVCPGHRGQVRMAFRKVAELRTQAWDAEYAEQQASE